MFELTVPDLYINLAFVHAATYGFKAFCKPIQGSYKTRSNVFNFFTLVEHRKHSDLSLYYPSQHFLPAGLDSSIHRHYHPVQEE